MSKRPDENDEEFSDEINPEDGLERHWLYFNGETLRLYLIFACAFFLILTGILYLIGAGEGALSIIARVLACASFLVWWVLGKRLSEYEESGWTKGKRLPRGERIERRVALFLWLFIFISAGAIILEQWARGRL